MTDHAGSTPPSPTPTKDEMPELRQLTVEKVKNLYSETGLGDNTRPAHAAVTRLTRTKFQSDRYFPALDGLRAVSVLAVLSWHNLDSLWTPLRGDLGVTVFFLISGFLITTLLLREEQASGQASISKFYIRRIFRIFPVYYLALGIFCVLVLVLHLGDDRSTFPSRLPYFLTYLNEFATPGTFGHSWSLGVEEKFYLVWPMVAFGALWLRRLRWVSAAVLLTLCIGAAYFPSTEYFGLYIPIMLGCSLALAMTTERGFTVARWLACPPVALAAIVLAAAAAQAEPFSSVHVWFSLLAVLMIPCFVLGGSWLSRPLESAPFIYIGRRSYGVYLFHPILLSMVDLVVPGTGSDAVAVVRFVLVTVSSLAVAAVIYRWFEQPLIRCGRRLVANQRGARKAQTKQVRASSFRSAS